MAERVVAPRARRDLEDIFLFISADDETAAWRVLQRVENTIRLLSENPFLGPSFWLAEDLGLRKMSVPPTSFSTAHPNGLSKSLGFSIQRAILTTPNRFGPGDPAPLSHRLGFRLDKPHSPL